MPPVIFNVGLFLDRRYMGDVIGLFCVSGFWCKSSVKDLIYVRLISYNYIEPQSLNNYNNNLYM